MKDRMSNTAAIAAGVAVVLAFAIVVAGAFCVFSAVLEASAALDLSLKGTIGAVIVTLIFFVRVIR